MKKFLISLGILATVTVSQTAFAEPTMYLAAVGDTTSAWTEVPLNQTDSLMEPADFTRRQLRISKEDDFEKFALKGVLFFLGFLGVIMLIVLIIGGYKMLASIGEEEAYTAGKKTVINAIIGFVIIILSYAIVNELLSSTSILRSIFSIFG